MTPRMTEMNYKSGFKIWLSFEDGREGKIDLKGELWGEMFEPLNDSQRFKTVRLNEELNTICWDNGADFAPEFLYAKLENGE